MDSLSPTPPFSPVAQAKAEVRREKAERQPSSSVQGANAEERAQDDRVARLEQMQRLADRAFAGEQGRLSIRYDEPARRFVYREVDRETGEVLRVYPPEDVLRRLAELRQTMNDESEPVTGVALDERS